MNKQSTFFSAALLITLSVFLFTVSHALVRSVGKSIHPYEIAFFTSLFSFVFYLPWLIRTKFVPLKTKKFGTHIVRACVNAGAVGAWYTALILIPLADAVAIALTSPLFVTVGAILFLGEKVFLRRWLAIGIGIFGALIIIRPGFQAIGVGMLFVLISIVLTSGSRLLAKQLTNWDSPAVIGAWVALLQIPITFCMAIYYWSWPNESQLLLLFLVGLLAGAAQYSMTVAYKLSDVSALEPFNFLRLVLAAIIGYFMFAELPDIWTWCGGVIIVMATSYVARREALQGKNKKIDFTPTGVS